MSPPRRGLIAASLFAIAIGATGVVPLLRPEPEVPKAPTVSAEASSRLKLQEALRDASLLDLIRNARVAARKGDSVTHNAMVTGLRREPGRAKSLIHSEIARSKDSADISILNRMIEELP